MALRAKDLDADYASLVADGFSTDSPPREIAQTGRRLFNLKDPEGNVLQVDWHLLVTVMLSMLLIQMIVPAARAATSYLSIDIGLDAVNVGVVSASYALLPVLLTFQIGQLTALRAGRPAIVTGVGLVALGIVALAWAPHTFWMLIAFTALLGVGQTLAMTAMQTIAVRASGRHHRDMVIGNTSMAIAVGHAFGPALIWAGARMSGSVGQSVLILCAFSCVSILVLSLLVARRVGQRQPPQVTGENEAGASIWNIPGMRWVLCIGALSATAVDLLVVFTPLLGTDRGLSPEFVGLLLTLRAIASIAVRFLYARLVRALGRANLMFVASGMAVLGFGALAFPLPDFGMALAMLACGFGLGIIGTNSMGMALSMVKPSLHAATISMRLGANRFLQFVMPLGLGTVAATLGAGSIFAIFAACLTGNAVMLRFKT